jgi:hypothetical protein
MEILWKYYIAKNQQGLLYVVEILIGLSLAHVLVYALHADKWGGSMFLIKLQNQQVA